MAAPRAGGLVSQPIDAEQKHATEPDPLLAFFAEPEAVPAYVATPDPPETVQPVAKAADAATVAAPPGEVDSGVDLRRRLDRAERLLEKSQIELSALKSDLATLVTAIDDIKKRQSRPSIVPRPPLPSTPASRRGIATAAALIVVLGFAAWGLGMVSTGSIDITEPPQIETVSAAPIEPALTAAVVEPPSPAASPAGSPAEPSETTAGVVPISTAAASPVTLAARTSAPARAPAEPSPSSRRAEGGYVGSLSVDSSPSGTVFLNRKNVGQTPLRLDNLRAGSHLVWIERDGHRRFTRVVAVAANGVARVTADLDPIP